jgi:hypothetical protein
MTVLDRTLRWITEQLAFLAVFLLLAAAFVYLVIEPRHWGRCSGLIAVAVLLAGVLRGALSSDRAGLLAVRTRVGDTVCYLVLGGVVLGLDIRLHG